MRTIEAEIRRHDFHGGGDGDGDGSTSGCRGSLLVDLGCGTGKFTREILPFARSEGAFLKPSLLDSPVLQCEELPGNEYR